MALEERLQLPLLLSSGLVLAARQKITRRCCWGEGEGGKVAGHLLEPEARSREDVAAIAASIRTGQDRTRNAPEPEKNGGLLAVTSIRSMVMRIAFQTKGKTFWGGIRHCILFSR